MKVIMHTSEGAYKSHDIASRSGRCNSPRVLASGHLPDLNSVRESEKRPKARILGEVESLSRLFAGEGEFHNTL
jgi:hypothetical protein